MSFFRRAFFLLSLAAMLGGCATEKANGRPWVHDIRFVGLKRIDKKDLKSKLSIQKTSWMPWAPRKYLDPFAVPGDQVRIEAYYRDHGYFGAKVVKVEVRPRKTRKKDSVDVVFTIVEGEPVRVASVHVTGLAATGRDQRKVEAMLPLKLGQPFVYDRYAAEKTLIDQRLQLHGYAWPVVNGQVEVDRDARTAAINIDAQPGLLAHLGRITAGGYNKTRAIDIVRTADLDTGHLYSPIEIETARGRVYNVGVYSSVRLVVEHDPVDPSIANVRVEVQEGQFHELRLGGGVDIEAQRNDVHLLARYTKRNFLGGMRVLTLRLEPAFVVVPAIWYANRTGTKYGPAAVAEAKLRQPLLGGVRHLDFVYTLGYDLDIDYAFQYHGPRTSLGVNYSLWRDRASFGLSYNIQFLQFFNTDPSIFTASDASQAGTVYGFLPLYRVAWLQQDLKLDLRDKPLDTHYGGYALFHAEEGGDYTGSAFKYEKIIPELRGYAPLGSRVTLAGRVQYGRVWTQGDLGSPITRRLYLGGPDSHRGFSYDRLSYQIPANCPAVDQAIGKCPSTRTFQPLPIGGDESFLVSAEVRVHVVKLWNNWLGFAAFVDGGDVSAPHPPKGSTIPPALTNALPNIDFTQLHWAVGGGLRYATIIGTIRFDSSACASTASAIAPRDPTTRCRASA